MSVFTFCSIDRKNFYMKSLTQGLNPRILCLLHWQTGSLLVMPNILCGPKSEVLFYHHVVRKWSPITQIWTYLSEGTASQISKHLVYALGAVHPFQDMPLDSMESKIVIFQKELLRNRSRDMTWGPWWLDHLSLSRMQPLFCSCPVISLKIPPGTRKISFLFVCLIWLEVITILCWFLTYINMNWHRYICVPRFLNTPYSSLSTLSTQVVPEHCLLIPCLMHQFALVMCFTYGLVRVLMLFSQIIPPLLSPTEYKGLFFTSVSLTLPCM